MRPTTTIGLDIAKSVFQVHRVDDQVLRPKTALTDRPALVQWIFGAAPVVARFVLPYVFAEVNSSSFKVRPTGVSDISFLCQVNIFGGPALTFEKPEASSADRRTSAWPAK
jgi:hypothetical protein